MTFFRSIRLTSEIRAIICATAPAVLSRKAMLRFRIWHHAKDERARSALFEEFVVGGERLGLIEALVECGEEHHPGAAPRLARQLMPAELAYLEEALKPALNRALKEVLGATATHAVLNAWDETFTHLFASAPKPDRFGPH